MSRGGGGGASGGRLATAGTTLCQGPGVASRMMTPSVTATPSSSAAQGSRRRGTSLPAHFTPVNDVASPIIVSLASSLSRVLDHPEQRALWTFQATMWSLSPS